MVSFSSSLYEEVWKFLGREQLVRDSQKQCVWKWEKVSTSILSTVACHGLRSQLTEALDESQCNSIPNWANGAEGLLSLSPAASQENNLSPLLPSIQGHSENTAGFFTHTALKLGLWFIVGKENDKFFCVYIIQFSHLQYKMYLQLWHCKTWAIVLYSKASAFLIFFLMHHFALSTGSLCQK